MCIYRGMAIASFLLIGSLFSLEIHSVDGDWRKEVIEEELSFMKDLSISSQDIEQASREYAFYLYVIKDNQLTVVPDDLVVEDVIQLRNSVVRETINEILALKPLPDMSFLVTMHDALPAGNCSMPCFGFSKRKTSDYNILMPDFEMLQLDPLFRYILDACIYYPWDKKVGRAFWRGSTTGDLFTYPTLQEFPRSKLVVIAQDFPSHVNAKFTNYALGSDTDTASDMAFLEELGGMVPHVSIEKHLFFKFLIDVDGFASTYSRFFWILLSNSTPLKVVSDHTQWYYKGLEPYRHYVPVEPDCSDLIEQIQWARDHDNEAEEIAKQSQEFALEYLNKDSVYSYLYHLLLSYSELLATD